MKNAINLTNKILALAITFLPTISLAEDKDSKNLLKNKKIVTDSVVTARAEDFSSLLEYNLGQSIDSTVILNTGPAIMQSSGNHISPPSVTSDFQSKLVLILTPF